MVSRDAPKFRFGGLCRDAVEELPGFHLPAPQVLAQDRCLGVVRKLLDPNRLTLAPKTQLTPASSPQVPHPFRRSARGDQISCPTDLQWIHRRWADVSRLSPPYNQDPRPTNTHAPARHERDEGVE